MIIKAVFWTHIRPSPGEYEEQCLQRSWFTGDSLLCLHRRPGPIKLRSPPARPHAALSREDGAFGRRQGGREPGVRPERQGSPQPGAEAGRGPKGAPSALAATIRRRTAGARRLQPAGLCARACRVCARAPVSCVLTKVCLLNPLPRVCLPPRAGARPGLEQGPGRAAAEPASPPAGLKAREGGAAAASSRRASHSCGTGSERSARFRTLWQAWKPRLSGS